MRYQRRSACSAGGAGSRTRPRGVAFAFCAKRSQRSPKSRRSAASSGELANFARRAHSAAWARQYITYDDITRSLTQHTRPTVPHLSPPQTPSARRPWPSASIPPTQCANKGITEPSTNSVLSCGIAATHLRARASSELAPIYVTLKVSMLDFIMPGRQYRVTC
jgi:hypothetical protein